MIVETPAELCQRHQTAIVALERLQRTPFADLSALLPTPGMTHAQALRHLMEVRVDLDERYVLALFAAVEATLKSDGLWRIHKGKRTHPATKAMKEISERSTWNRLRLEDLLRAWRDLAATPRPFSELIRISHRRHWLAHGKYFPDRSGVGQIEPADVLSWWEQAEREAQAVAPGFPRDDSEL